MSTSGENRWRASQTTRSNGANRTQDRTATPTQAQQQQNQRNQSNSQSSTPQPSTAQQPQPPQQQQQAPPPVPNVWANRAGASNGKNNNVNGRTTSPVVTNGVPTPTLVVAAPQANEEKYNPVGGFNGDEVKEYFKKAYQEAIAGDTTKQSLYRSLAEVVPASNSNNKSSSTARPAWGAKASFTSTDSDFLGQLAKQLATADGHERGG